MFRAPTALHPLAAQSALASLVATGTANDDVLTGSTAADTLDGGLGADTMVGDKGDDTYIVDNVGDVVTELAKQGIDTVLSSVSWTLGNDIENLTLTSKSAVYGTGNALNNVLTGSGSDNVLSGLDGNDTLDGQGGVDTLVGGNGNDTYLVDSTKETVTELTGGGTDTVISSVSYTLGAELENITLTGNLNLNATGNSLNNVLTGSTGANVLTGGLGNDTYIVDNVGDVVVELAGQGGDLVKSSISYTLGANVEKLTLTGAYHINGTGNTLKNIITGNDSRNVLDGGDNNDTLIGGANDDTLIGGLGADSMQGDAGSDFYMVDNVGDVVVETWPDDSDIDTVTVGFDYTLGDYVENLIMTGSAVYGTGNNWNNVITGTAQNNLLLGFGGDDTLIGGDGNDTLDCAGGHGELQGGNGDDVLLGSEVEFYGLVADGGDGNDTLTITLQDVFYGAPDMLWTINGTLLSGASSMDELSYWFAQGSTYSVGNDEGRIIATMSNVENLNVLVGSYGNDLVFALGNGTVYDGSSGIDTFYADWGNATSAINWVNTGGKPVTINGAQVSGMERLLLVTGSGNDLLDNSHITTATNDDLRTGAGNDTLDGGLGADNLVGGTGNDTYKVDNVGDVIVEDLNSGIDSVTSSVSYTLSDNVEKLTLSGTALNGIGNALNNTLSGDNMNNVLIGNDGNDTLRGGFGSDTLTGGSGADHFGVYSLPSSDTITDFAVGQDIFEVSQSHLAIGNGDQVISASTGTLDSFSAASELVIFGDDLAGALSTGSAAAHIGSASSAYTTGQTALFVLDNGTDTAVYYFKSAGNDAVVSASELTLLATLTGTHDTGAADYLFVS